MFVLASSTNLKQVTTSACTASRKAARKGPHALDGVDALFFPPVQRRPGVARLTPGPPTAASQMPNSLSVASGCWRTQDPIRARAGASRRGAGPLQWSNAAGKPLRRCNSLATNETGPLN